MTLKYHINGNGEIKICKATKRACPLGGGHFPSAELAEVYRSKQMSTMQEIYNNKLETGEIYTQEEARQRGLVVSWKTREALKNEEDTEHIYYDFDKNEWKPERQKQQRKILDKLINKYKDVPNEKKSIFSAGLPGAGKTTVLTGLKSHDIKRYATVSSDDIKEMMAAEGMIPKIEGLTPMESSTLVHEESSYLANELLEELGNKGTNIIYDFTCSSKGGATKRIDILSRHGYSTDDMQFVFVDIPIATAKERAIGRYEYGLNQGLKTDLENKNLTEEEIYNKHNIAIGGRFLPEKIINGSKPKGENHCSINAETIIELSKDKELNLPEPIVYDNSGTGPIPVDFELFFIIGRRL